MSHYERAAKAAWEDTDITVTWSGKHSAEKTIPEDLMFIVRCLSDYGIKGPLTLAFSHLREHQTTSEDGYVRAVGDGGNKVCQGKVAIKVLPPGKHVEFRFLLSSQDGLTPWDIIAKLGGAETAEEDIPTDGEPAESNEEGASEEAHKVALACMARSVQVIYAIASEMTSRNRATLTRGQVRGITRKALGELAGSPSRVTNEDINATFGMLTESSCIVCMTGGEYYLGSRAFGTVIEFIPEGCTSEQAEIILDGLKAFLTLGPYVTLRNQTWTVRGELDGHRLEAERLEAKAEGIRGRIRELQAQASELERLKTGETTAIESCQRVIDGAEAVLDGVKIDESLATVEFALLDVITAPPKVSNS